jgi:hypothetical protein
MMSWRATYQVVRGGGRRIRTPEPLSGLTVFKTAGFNRSPIPPDGTILNYKGFSLSSN